MYDREKNTEFWNGKQNRPALKSMPALGSKLYYSKSLHQGELPHVLVQLRSYVVSYDHLHEVDAA